MALIEVNFCSSTLVYTIVASSIGAPLQYSSGAMKRVDPHMRPIGLQKGA